MGMRKTIFQQAFDQGISQGISQGQHDDILKLYLYGMPPENIAQALRRDLNHVKKILAEGQEGLPKDIAPSHNTGRHT